MFTLEFIYDGKKYENFENTLNKAVIDGMKKTVIESLKPFEAEINKHGGRVIVNIPKNLENADIKFKGLPDELIKRIEESFEEE